MATISDERRTQKRRGGKLIDAAERFMQRRVGSAAPVATSSPLLAPAPQTTAEQSSDGPISHRRALGQRDDGAIDLAAWRAKWIPIFKADFHTGTDGQDPDSEEDGSLNIFHDKRSNALEYFAMRADGASVRHVLSPRVAMRLLIALNAAYGFDPKGPDGRSILDLETDDPGPMTA